MARLNRSKFRAKMRREQHARKRSTRGERCLSKLWVVEKKERKTK